MNSLPKEAPLKLAILQRVCAPYRTAMFSQLAAQPGVEMKLFIGANIPGTKVQGTSDLEGIPFQKLPTRMLRMGRRVLTWHVGLIGELRRFKPDVILCEGESHFVGYLQAIVYRALFNPKAALIHWCFISLPGHEVHEKRPGAVIKGFFRRFFDAHLLYSSFSRDCLMQLGVPEVKAFVATNVGDVRKFIKMSDSLPDTPAQARESVGLPEKFTAVYVGTLDENKHPEMLLDLAGVLDKDQYNFVLLGTGPMLEPLRARATREGLSNVFLPGRVADGLALYYRSADALLIPGRGGIVISEAMAFGVPVVVHEADGTEYDLVQHQVTGVRLQRAGLEDFSQSLKFLQGDPELCARMGKASRELCETRYTTENMVKQTLSAARFARNARSGRA